MRKVLLWFALSVLFVTPVFAKSEKLTVEGTTVTLDVQEKSGRKMYPLRTLCNALGIQIEQADGQTVTLCKDDNEVVYLIGSGLIRNDSGYFKCDVSAMSINNTTYVPIRSVAYMFGYDISTAGGIHLSKKADFVPPTATAVSRTLGEELYILGLVDEVFEEDAYIDAFQNMLYSGDYSQASTYRNEVLTAKSNVESLKDEFTTQTAKAVYKEYINILGAYADLFAHVDAQDADAMLKDMEKINAIAGRINDKLDNYIQVLRKNAISIK